MVSMDCGVEEKNTMVSLAAGGDWCEEDNGVEEKGWRRCVVQGEEDDGKPPKGVNMWGNLASVERRGWVLQNDVLKF